MSENGDGTAKIRSGWTEYEILVCLINAVEQSGVKLDFNSVAYPPGRSASGFTQKMNALKKSLKAELDAINSGQPIPDAVTTPKKPAARKRKAPAADEDGGGTPKKRGRPKKGAAPEVTVKDEPEGEQELDVEAEI